MHAYVGSMSRMCSVVSAQFVWSSIKKMKSLIFLIAKRTHLFQVCLTLKNSSNSSPSRTWTVSRQCAIACAAWDENFASSFSDNPDIGRPSCEAFCSSLFSTNFSWPVSLALSKNLRNYKTRSTSLFNFKKIEILYTQNNAPLFVQLKNEIK